MRILKKVTVAAASALAIAAVSGHQAAAIPVDAEILLLMDVSGSVDTTEFGLQRDGYVQAFQSLAVKNAIAGATNGVAVSLVQWSGAGQQSTSIGFTHLTDASDSDAFATQISNIARAFNGLTAIGDALNNTYASFGLAGTEQGEVNEGVGGNGFESLRQVIDVSGDGTTNDGIASSTGRDAALAAGVDVINGVVILGESGLLTHYQTQVIGGTNGDGSPAFALTANDFSDFTNAITAKLEAEVSGGGDPTVPEPAALAVFGVGLAAFGYARRRRKA